MNMKVSEEDVHLVVAGLLEMAMRDQGELQKVTASVDSAAAKLNQAARDFPRSVASDFEAATMKAAKAATSELLTRFSAVVNSANEATSTFQSVTRAGISRWVFGALGIVMTASLAMVGMALAFAPSFAEIQVLELRKQQLEHQIAELESTGANSAISTCSTLDGRKRLPCAKLDPKYGDLWKGYRVLQQR